MKIMVGYRRFGEDTVLLEHAARQALAFDGSVILVTSMRGGEQVKLKDFTRAEHELDKAKEYFESKRIKVETKLLERGLSVGEDLVKYSKEAKVDEILIRVKNRSKVGKLIFGSTAQFVILKAKCPVVSIK
jgi:nucleotide-binding universal stress UspA family protein